MDDLLGKAKEIANEVGETGKDILEGLAREGKEVVEKVKDLLDGDDQGKVDPPKGESSPKPEGEDGTNPG